MTSKGKQRKDWLLHIEYSNVQETCEEGVKEFNNFRTFYNGIEEGDDFHGYEIVKKYPFFALTVNPHGDRECMHIQDLYQISIGNTEVGFRYGLHGERPRNNPS